LWLFNNITFATLLWKVHEDTLRFKYPNGW